MHNINVQEQNHITKRKFIYRYIWLSQNLSYQWLAALTSSSQKDLNKFNNQFLLFYGVWGSKVPNFLVTLIIDLFWIISIFLT